MWEEPYILAAYQVAKWTPRGVPLVFLTMQSYDKRYPQPFRTFESSVMRRSAGWTCCGQLVAEVLLRRPGYDAKPMANIPLGVDVTAFRPDAIARTAVRQSLGWDPDGPPVIGYLGRFVPEKGLPMMMRVLDRLNTPWRALLVGSGPLIHELQSWAARHGDRVRLCTSVKHADVPAYINAMDVLAAPSQTAPHWREQFGRMLIEAFACGVPVVASDSGEIPHVLADAGQIVAEADEDAWVRALAEMMESPARQAELAARGLERARQFSWLEVGRRYADFFDTVTSSEPH